jgi:agmatine/peptidylarginine deiminase
MRFKNRIKYIIFSFITLFLPIFLSNPCTAQFGIFNGIPDYSFKIPSPYIPNGRIFSGVFGTYSGLNNSNPFYGGYYRRPGFKYPFYNGYFGSNGYYGFNNYGLYGGYGGYALPFSSNIPFAGNGYGFPSYGSLNIYDINRLPYPNTSNAARPIQPTGFVYCPAEYEPIEGLIIAWEKYPWILTELTVGITLNDPEAIMYIAVDNSFEQIDVNNTLDMAGADMSQVEFIVHPTDTIWIRDYGPRFVFEDGERTIIDYTYTHMRENDNLFNDYLSNFWDEPQYQISIEHGGGNFHMFVNGDAFMTSVVFERNPSLTEQDVKNLFREYKNLDVTIYPRFPSSFDLTGHIDMWMLPVGTNKVIIGEYASSTGEPHIITEGVTGDLESRGYTVYRTPGWKSGITHYTYTNSIILNDLVFIPRYGGPWSSNDDQALAVFREAFPDHNIMQIDCSQIIMENGALHCIVMHVPA